MLVAASEIFLEQGFGGASMEAVAKKAGISKKTIYGFVPTKEKLFEAVMQDHMEYADLPHLPDQVADAAGVEAALADYLNRLSAAILGPTAAGLFRVVIAESVRFPEVAQTFYREGGLRHITELGAWLGARAKQGLVALDDPGMAARILTSFIILEPLRAAAMGLGALPAPALREQRARMAAKIFVNGCANR
jgi:AcrR family transcriptional regulator